MQKSRKAQSRRSRSAQAKMCTAYHEAGHAVVHLLEGLCNESVTIKPGHGYTGLCVSPNVLGYYSSTRTEQRNIARSLIIASYAGFESERMFDKNADPGRSVGDYENVRWLASSFGVLPRCFSHVGDEFCVRYWESLRNHAERIVRQNFALITAVADALRKRETLTGEDVEFIVASFD